MCFSPLHFCMLSKCWISVCRAVFSISYLSNGYHLKCTSIWRIIDWRPWMKSNMKGYMVVKLALICVWNVLEGGFVRLTFVHLNAGIHIHVLNVVLGWILWLFDLDLCQGNYKSMTAQNSSVNNVYRFALNQHHNKGIDNISHPCKNIFQCIGYGNITNMDADVWERHSHNKWDVIAHSCPNISNLVKQPFESGHGWITTCYTNHGWHLYNVSERSPCWVDWRVDKQMYIRALDIIGKKV